MFVSVDVFCAKPGCRSHATDFSGISIRSSLHHRWKCIILRSEKNIYSPKHMYDHDMAQCMYKLFALRFFQESLERLYEVAHQVLSQGNSVAVKPRNFKSLFESLRPK